MAFFTMIYSARYLGVANFGILSFGLAFSGIMVIFADLGLSSLTVREVARDKELSEKYIKNIGLIKLILSLITFISSILILFIIGYGLETIIVVALITCYSLFASFSIMLYSLFQAHEKMEYQALGAVLNALLLLAGILLVIYYNMGILSFGLVYFFAGLFIFLFNFIICRWKFVLPRLEIDLPFWRELFRGALPLSLAIIFATIAFKVDTVLLSILANNISVGIYSASYRLIEVLLFIPSVFIISVYPVFSLLYKSSRESLKFSYEKSFKYLTLISIPIAFGVTLLADDVILLLYGTQYTGAVLALKILIWAIPAIFLTDLSNIIFISMNRQNVVVKFFIIIMIINITLNVIFIPMFSYIAASVVTVITEFTSMLFLSYFLYRYVGKIQYRWIIKPLIASLIMGLFIFYTDLNIFVHILVGTGIYFLALFFLGTFSDEDLELFKRIIARKEN